MDKKQRFEDFLAKRNDDLDNAAYAMATLMLSGDGTPPTEDDFPWSMEIIGDILESTKSILEGHGYPTCWPYHEDDVPCPDTNSCKHKSCPLHCGHAKEATTNE